MDYVSGNMTGWVGSGYIRIRGFVFLLGTATAEGLFRIPMEWPQSLEGMTYPNFEEFTLNPDESRTEESYLCIHSLFVNQVVSWGEYILHGLVLRLVEQQQSIFSRAGHFRCTFSDPEEYYTFLNSACSLQDAAAGQFYRSLKIL